MKRSLMYVGIALAMAFWSLAPARAEFLKDLFGCKEIANSTCVVRESIGGFVHQFAAAASEAKTLRIRIVFRHMCVSACTLFADRVRNQSCITRSVQFGFHKFMHYGFGDFDNKGIPRAGSRPNGYYEPDYSPILIGWLNSMGGIPAGNPTFMTYEQARLFWPAC